MVKPIGLLFILPILLCSVAPAHCQTNTTLVLQDQPVDWQAESKHRGTWGIIINCLTTIIAGTWSIQHLNVPLSSDGPWSRRWRGAKWMIITILFPEFMVVHALFELLMAIEALKTMNKNKAKSVDLPWWWFSPPQSPSIPATRMKSFRKLLASLWHRTGQSVMSLSQRFRHATLSSCCGRKDLEAQATEDRRQDAAWTLTHCFFANMGGTRYQCADQGEDEDYPFTALQIAHYNDNEDHDFNKPEMTLQYIQDVSKTNVFAKVIAGFQLLQLVLSLVVRTAQGMAFSQLETLTVGFAACGFFTYIFYWYKPQGVETSFAGGMQHRHIYGNRKFYDIPDAKTFDSFWDVLINKKKMAHNPTLAKRIPNDNIPIYQNQWGHPGIFVLALASALFGAIHAIAWEFEFPSVEEKMLWHMATIVAVASPVAGLLLVPVAQLTVPSGDAHAFIGDCLRLLREYSWHTRDKYEVDAVYTILEAIYIMKDTNSEGAQQLYRNIFFLRERHNIRDLDADPELPGKLLDFLNVRGDHKETRGLEDLIQKSFTDTFKSDFDYLVRLMKEEESKKLNGTAITNVFPRKIWLPNWLNLCVLYSTSVLYILARLSLLAMGFSSLRKLPASVYVNTPWTAYIPSVG
ncbi:hypothetical protein PG987_010133 [Apiospora arundinis]